jgi:L-threonylcarbamoyladenylate synthase
MLASHYAPAARVILVNSLQEADETMHEWSPSKKVRILHFGDVNEYAENLYDELRKADQQHHDLVIAVRAPSSGLGIAINDRLSKAAADR